MLALPKVMHLFPHEFAGLRTGRFTLTGVLMRPLQSFFLRHGYLLSTS